MADDVEESEVFEITDFTTASEWERFISRLEQVIHDWRLTSALLGPPLKKGEFTSGKWEEKSENISFANFHFLISEHRLKMEGEEDEGEESEQEDDGSKQEEEDDKIPQPIEDMLSSGNDFPPRAHCLCRWYGLRHFVVLSPAANSEAILSESKCNLLLSSLTIAVNNTNCAVPMFAQIQQKWRRMYTGVCEAPGVRTTFDIVHLKRIPHQYNHLEGLVNVFKSKLASPISPIPEVNVAVRFTYVLHDWTQFSWPLLPPDLDMLEDDNDVGYPGFTTLPYGAVEDPVSELHLAATWPSFAEDMIVDNDAYSDLDPLQAPQWSARVHMTENPSSLLADYLKGFAKLAHSKESIDQLLGGGAFEDDDDETSEQVSLALHRLTDPARVPFPTLSSVMSRAQAAQRRRRTQGNQASRLESPIPVNILNDILVFLFPDASAVSTPAGESASTPNEDTEKDFDKKERYRHFKTAPESSLTYKLAISMCVVNQCHGGLKGVAHLWHEFVLEMRYRLENNYNIPGLGSTTPNMGCCLLHQKLQMLNCCIDRKKDREERRKRLYSKDSNPSKSSLSSDQTDDRGSPSRESSAEGGAPSNEQITRIVRAASSRSKESDDSEEEFFECDDATPPDEGGLEEQSLNSRNLCRENDEHEDMDISLEDAESKDVGNEKDQGSGKEEDGKEGMKPEGRLKPCGELRLLHTNEVLYIPVTQDPAPMTEDMLEEHAEVLAQLGTSSEGMELRARMQSACLLSDMESFKAANPGCTLEDFVRWYSPRDWVDLDDPLLPADEQGSEGRVRGQLSQRMQLPGNTWQEVWSQSRAVPSHRQKRLFDDTKEAEKVLHFLASLKPSELVLHLLPALVHAALQRLEKAGAEKVPSLKPHFPQLLNTASRMTRAPVQDIKKYEEIVKQVGLVEVIIARDQSLRAKFLPSAESGTDHLSHAAMQELEEFVTKLQEQPEVFVHKAGRGVVGGIIHKLYSAAQRSAHMLTDDSLDQGDNSEGYSSPPISDKDKISGGSSSSVPDFPRPAGREFILRSTVPRPAPYSRPTPQRMYCVLLDDDFRLAGAFTEDTSFQ
ncbi:rab3 GTPase-activating protein catalytic subunit-like [Lytechinus variegatus]|uniref:rab3 GTPase-activating protein catalytic subunit-like n=1 Tax=Lytechinus variegatus TaxID=7654 RepID=UPI001BB21B52|nr:rab3 GTPase-activating protein catalytic subunit-like [Lytechinus variegatus]